MSDSDESSAVERALRRAGELDEDNPAEPDEFDPDSLGPDPPDPTAADGTFEADEETVRVFWTAVVLANLGLFAVSLGPMLVYFRGQVTLGGALVAVGLVALGRTYYTYREYTSGETA